VSSPETKPARRRRPVPDDKKSTAAPKEEAPAAQTADPDAYAPERLIAEAEARFGVAPHVAAGAFAASESETLSLDEAKGLIADFQKQEVAVDNPIPSETEGEEG
jgi:hypothetical protein